MKEERIEQWPLSKVRPYEGNPRKISDKAISVVAESIREFGFKNPILVDRDGVIIAGHTRRLAAEKLQLKEVPVIVCDDLSDNQVKALRLADNKTAEFSEWDMDALQAEILGVDDIDMEVFGFEMPETEEDLIESLGDDFDESTEDIQSMVKEGEIWQLGDHRLICGDSTDPEDISRLMDGKEADLAVTDPPYNVDYEGGTKDGLKIKNDKMTPAEFEVFLERAFRNMEKNLRRGGGFYVWHASRSQREFENALEAADLKVRQQLIWNKSSLVLGRQDYQWKHEPCFYGWKDGAAHYFVDSRSLMTVIADKAEINPKKMTKDKLVKFVEEILSDKVSTTVINEDKPSASEEHPTMKPVKLIGRLILNSSRTGESVLDLFGGSGTTLIACEQLGRTCYMSELDPHYCDVIIARWEKLTGKRAVRVATGDVA